jgi:pyridoxamine 5'-phosphate oxidase
MNPIEQFNKWFEEALNAKTAEPNAMHLATISGEGRPTARIVLLKGLDTGFCFYTNYTSKKGQELLKTPFAALTFFWVELERQVRIEGKVEKMSEAESDAYFNSRPEGSRVGAWVSDQSKVIQNRELLEQKQSFFEEKFNDKIIERPPHWGGFRVIPDKIEFWQGRPSRLHDRLCFILQEDRTWAMERLQP